MSKKGSKKKRKQDKSKPPIPKDTVAELNAKVTFRSWIMGRTVIVLAGPTILATYAMYVYFWENGDNTSIENTWGNVVILLLLLLSLAVILVTMSIDLAAKTLRVQESAKQKNLRLETLLKLLTIYVTTVLYGMSLEQGYLDGLAAFLKSNVFPTLSSGVNYILSNLLGWAVSGVVGNFVYDLLKRFIVTRKEK